MKTAVVIPDEVIARAKRRWPDQVVDLMERDQVTLPGEGRDHTCTILVRNPGTIRLWDEYSASTWEEAFQKAEGQ
jgi:hypothetical protein